METIRLLVLWTSVGSTRAEATWSSFLFFIIWNKKGIAITINLAYRDNGREIKPPGAQSGENTEMCYGAINYLPIILVRDDDLLKSPRILVRAWKWTEFWQKNGIDSECTLCIMRNSELAFRSSTLGVEIKVETNPNFKKWKFQIGIWSSDFEKYNPKS